jgi:hypothetical protein
VKAKAVKAARTAAKIEAIRVLDGNEPPRWQRAIFKLIFFFPDNREKDPDNCAASCKAYIDGLADARIVGNDKNLWPERPVIFYRSKMPRVEIEIEPIC